MDRAQDRYNLRFPPDLIDLLLDRQPINGYNWNVENPRIREMLAWPRDMLIWDIEHGLWCVDWGDRPAHIEDRKAVLAHALVSAPALIPLYSHRFIPEAPRISGYPIFSMHGFDTIYYGSNLDNYLAREFGDTREVPLGEVGRCIPFWSDLAEDQDKWI